MIDVTRLDGARIVLNSDLIESIEATPDVVITLTTGKKIMVTEKMGEIITRIIDFKRRIHRFGDGAVNN